MRYLASEFEDFDEMTKDDLDEEQEDFLEAWMEIYCDMGDDEIEDDD